MLKVWIPGTTDFRDQGLGGTEWINDNVTIVNDGKLGKCMSFNGTNSRLSTTGFELSNKWSFALWAKDIGTLNRWQVVLMLNSNGSDSDSQMSFWVMDNYQAERDFPRFEISANGKWRSNLPYTPGEWHYFAGTYDGAKMLFYYDGENIGYQNNTNEQLVRHNLTIGARSASVDGGHVSVGNSFTGLINDVRIWDNEVISPKMIKMLSQGMICHMPLNRDGFGADNIIPNTYDFKNWTREESVTCEINENGWNLIDSHRPTNTTSRWGIYYNDCLIEPNTDYYISWEQIGNMTIQLCTNKTLTSKISIINNRSFNSAELFGNTSPSYMRVYVYPTASKNYVASIRNLKIEKGATATPWTPNPTDSLYTAMGLDSDIVYDVSGYQNNGELYTTDGTGEFIWESDTPKYNVSCRVHSLNSTQNSMYGTAYIRANCGLVEPEQLTIAFWCYARSEGYGGETNQGVFCTTNNTGSSTGSDYQDSAMNHRDSIVNINRVTDKVQLNLGIMFIDNEWHHYAFTYDGQNARSYRDGVLIDTQSFSSPVALNSFSSVILGFSKAGGVWRRNNNNYSDLRVYATCLSAADIAALYNAPISLSSSGTLFSNELSEV